MSHLLYVFDMDETLINADCSMLWNAFLVEKGIATEPNFLEEDQRLMGLYAQGELDMEDYLAFAMAPITHLPIAEVHQLVEECLNSHVMPTLFQSASSLLEQLKRDGIDILIISASVSFLVEAVARRLGLTQALGIDIVEKEGCYSAQISGVPSYREGKVTRLEAWVKQQPKSYSEVHFYTDSINDLPLCEYADYAYLVNPCPQLAEFSHRENWTVLNWD